jgi:hypothetical protein
MATASLGRLCSWLLLVLGAELLLACGGGAMTNDQLLSGTAVAQAAPLVKSAVHIRCADGSVFNSVTNDSGIWQVVMTTQPLPCALQVSGGTWNGVANVTSYHAIAIHFGANNITPLSNLVVARLTGLDPQTWFANPDWAGVNASTLNAALATVSNALGMAAAIRTFDPLTVEDVLVHLVTVLSAIRATQDDPAVPKTDAQLLEAARSGDFSGFTAFAAIYPVVYASLN